MASAHPFGAFARCRFKRIGCVRTIKVNIELKMNGCYWNGEILKNGREFYVKKWVKYNVNITRRTQKLYPTYCFYYGFVEW